MERRKVPAVAVSGKPLSIPADSRLTWMPLGDSKGVVLVGVSGRQEDDIEFALAFACDALGEDRKLTVKEVSIQVDRGRAKLEHPTIFDSDLQKLEAGEASVSSDIAKVYGRQFLFEPIEDAKESWFLLRGKRGRPSRVRGLRPTHAALVGRNRELSDLLEFVEQVREDEGQIVGVVGDAGIGKTRLLDAFKEKCKGAVAIQEGAFKVGSQRPYEAFRSIVSALVGGVTATLSRWEMTEAETDFLRLFLEPDRKVDRLAGLTDEQIRQGLFFSVRKLIHLAAKNPLVCVLEDLHWADPLSLQLLEYLIEGIEKTRLLLVLLHRPEGSGPWQKLLNYTEIRITPFENNEIEQFVRELLSVTHVDQRLTRGLSRVSLGNPLFVEEILRSLLDRGTVETETTDRGEKAAVLMGEFPQDVPTTLRTLLVSRLDRLSSEAREVLRWASLLGPAFQTQELEELMARLNLQNARGIVKDLESQNFIQQKSEFPTQIHKFIHDLLFEVVQETIADRPVRHQEIAQFLKETLPKETTDSLVRIGEHSILGDDAEAAVWDALAAGNALVAQYQYPSGARMLKAAAHRYEEAGLTAVSPEDVYAPLARALLSIGELENARAAIEHWKNSKVVFSARAQAALAHLDVQYYSAIADEKAVIEVSERALHAMEPFPELEDARYDVIHDRIDALLGQGKAAQAFHESLAALRGLKDKNNPIARMRIWARAGFCATLAGSPDMALDFVSKAQALAPKELPPNLRMELARRVANALENIGRYEEGVRIYTEAIAVAEELGLRRWVGELLYYRGMLAAFSGDYGQGLADLSRATEIGSEIREPSLVTRASLGTCDMLLDIGAIERAQEVLRKWKATNASSTDDRQKVLIAAVEAEAETLKRNYGKAAALFHEVAELHDALHDTGYKMLALMRALILEAMGNLRPMGEIVDEYNKVSARGRNLQIQVWKDIQKVGAFLIAASGGGRLEPSPSRDMDPTRVSMAHFRQWILAAKTRWLRSIGDDLAAAQVASELRELRRKISEKVPEELRTIYERHPLFWIEDQSGPL